MVVRWIILGLVLSAISAASATSVKKDLSQQFPDGDPDDPDPEPDPEPAGKFRPPSEDQMVKFAAEDAVVGTVGEEAKEEEQVCSSYDHQSSTYLLYACLDL